VKTMSSNSEPPKQQELKRITTDVVTENETACTKCELEVKAKPHKKINNKKKGSNLRETLHKRGKHSCSVCGKALSSYFTVHRHMLSQHGINKGGWTDIHKCPHCQTLLYGKYLYESHMTQGNKDLECKMCLERFPVRCLLRKHWSETNHGEICLICKKVTNSKKTLQVHVRSVHLNKAENKPLKQEVDSLKKEKYVCKICRKYFCGKSSLRVHLNTHKKTFKCEICCKTFSRYDLLTCHMDQVHTKERPFQCNICTKAFSSRNYLVTHIQAVHSSNMHPCDKCNKQFKTKYILRQHLKTVCNDKIDCSFPGCEETFKTNHSRYIHRMRHHFPETIPNCKICGRSFTKKEAVPLHMATAHGEGKLLKCGECDKSYGYKHCLERHMRNHTGERPFACNVCGLTFTQKVVMQNHLRTHSGEKNHQCDVCGMRFGTKFFMLKHAEKHKKNYKK